MEKDIVRLLRAEEIECRVSVINEKGLSLLLYKDARVDQRILDETFGPYSWKRSHQAIEGNLYCTVEVYNKESGEWIAKQDVGASGYAEKEKSQASDSFKRACFNWGIGRELYTAPFIWISADKCNIQKKGEKFFCYTKFIVKDIEYNEKREIVSLNIIDDKGKNVYFMKNGKCFSEAKKDVNLSDEQLRKLNEEMRRTGVEIEDIRTRFPINNLEDMSQDIYKKVMAALKITKSEKAA